MDLSIEQGRGRGNAGQLFALVAIALASACSNEKLRQQASIEVVIAAPADGTRVQLTDSITFTARAANATGLISLALQVGSAQLIACPSATGATSLECSGTFTPKDHAKDISQGALQLTALATATDGGTGSAQVSVVLDPTATALVIDAPAAATSAGATQSISFQAHATNPSGLTQLWLSAGADALTSCKPAAADPTTISCQVSLTLQDHASQLKGGVLTLTARATDSHDTPVMKTVTVTESQLTLNFVQPALTQLNPPVAAVKGSSPIELSVTGSAQIQSLVVTDVNLNRVAGFTAAPFLANVSWGSLGVGLHTLYAVVHDAAGNATQAQRVVQVSCTADSDCTGGERCCTTDGACHPVVASGADCDCQHPCPSNEGCFPGTCGGPPQKCRPGCDPGSDNPSRVPQDCANQNGVIAYCANLPPGQVTPQNHGGACAPGDGCNVAKQDCPNALLNLSLPAGPGNPVVPYTCEPVSKTATACFPAGTNPAQDNNPNNHCLDAADTCGNDTAGCVKGLLCTGLIGNPGAGLACNAQCTDPIDPNNYPFGPPQSKTCGTNPPQYCDQLQGTGGQIVLTGICQNI